MFEIYTMSTSIEFIINIISKKNIDKNLKGDVYTSVVIGTYARRDLFV